MLRFSPRLDFQTGAAWTGESLCWPALTAVCVGLCWGWVASHRGLPDLALADTGNGLGRRRLVPAVMLI